MADEGQLARKAVAFDEMVDLDRWQPMEDYFAGADSIVEADVRAAAELRRKLRKELLQDSPELAERIKRPKPETRAWAREQLFGGHVVGIDGTVSKAPSISGGRARIGVAAVSYQGSRIQRVLYVSYREMAQPATSAMEYFKSLKGVNRTSELLMRAVMAYSERALALTREEEWRFVHGELLPYELWAALGHGRPLERRLALARRLIEAKNVIGVVEGSHNVDLLNAGELLQSGEYLEARDLRRELDDFSGGHRGDGRGAHFNARDAEDFKAFSERYGPDVAVGIFKAGLKTYIFHAHRSRFDEAAALVLADASNQALRGFPLLIDYADHLLRHYLAQSDFERQVEFKTARLGMETLAEEIDPRRTRRP